MKIIVIGAGLGGLSAACLLASSGHEVTVFEKNDSPGGKMSQIKKKKFRFDTGPSLLTMPWQLESLYKACGTTLDEQLTIESLSPICRYFFHDGSVFDNFSDSDKNFSQLKKIAPLDASNFLSFLHYSARLYENTSTSFIYNPLFDFTDFKALKLQNFLKIDAFKSMSGRIDDTFDSNNLRQFFKRFATYNGSSPYKAPATFNVIPHVEINTGSFYVKGGLYSIIKSLFKLAVSLGVKFKFEQPVEQLAYSGLNIDGVFTQTGKFYDADLVVCNADAHQVYSSLLPAELPASFERRNALNAEPSCSGFVLLMGCNKRFPILRHHNVFFSHDYEWEFHQIFERKELPEAPTIYIANTSYSDPSHAPIGSSNLFVLVNAPHLSKGQKWNKNKKAYALSIIQQLEERGLSGLKESIVFKRIITPKDFQKNYWSHKGSIYGTSSNSRFSAFLRAKNKSRKINGLYLVGGSTHPGGGIPLVIQSAFNAVALINRYERE